MIYPGNKGLFQRTIAESGTIAAWAVTHGNTNYEHSIKFAESLGCSDFSNISSCLKSKSEAEVISAALQMRSFNEVNMTWAPVYDNEFVLSETYDILSELSDPQYRLKYANFWEIDLMIGANNFDGAVYQDLFMLYINNTTPTSISYNISKHQFNDIIVPRVIEGFLGEIPTKLSSDMTIYQYTDWEDPFNVTKRLQNTLDILTDSLLNAPSISTAKSHVNAKTSTYVYQFSAKPPKSIVPIAPQLEGPHVACHSDEIPFVFGFADNILKYWNFTVNIIKPSDYQLSREMIEMWTSFAKSG
jgi:carboxylesterase type B